MCGRTLFMLKTFYKLIDMPVVPEIERVNLQKNPRLQIHLIYRMKSYSTRQKECCSPELLLRKILFHQSLLKKI